MLALGFGDWVFWADYNPPSYLGQQKVTFDGLNRLILINEGVTQLDFKTDVYSAWKEWLKDPNHVNMGYAEAISVVGGDPLPGNRAVGTTFFLENNWRMRTWEGDHELTVDGNFFTREGVPVFVPTLQPWTITINLNTSTLVDTVFGETSLTPGDISSIATNVWDQDLTGITAQDRLEALAGFDSDVWAYIIDNTKSESAKEKLRKIATKTQDIALS